MEKNHCTADGPSCGPRGADPQAAAGRPRAPSRTAVQRSRRIVQQPHYGDGGGSAAASRSTPACTSSAACAISFSSASLGAVLHASILWFADPQATAGRPKAPSRTAVQRSRTASASCAGASYSSHTTVTAVDPPQPSQKRPAPLQPPVPSTSQARLGGPCPTRRSCGSRILKLPRAGRRRHPGLRSSAHEPLRPLSPAHRTAATPR